MEAPSNSFIDTKPERLRGVFNWKFTYRNGTTAAQTSLLPARGSRVWTKRSALVVWAASNLRTPSKREQFVEEHVEVDVCGRCGDRSTSSLSEKLECLRFVGHTYYFYLCMEGALCVDYVTEKFANPVAHGMIPVVLGDYLSRAAAAPPPRSYVDTQWFPMLLHLVAHLRMVAADPDFFERHFNWRATGTIVIDCTTTIAHLEHDVALRTWPTIYVTRADDVTVCPLCIVVERRATAPVAQRRCGARESWRSVLP
ncbi:hypothetical protein HPB49_000162 [Dermacentor silvarum]|uniref:Uncharacterized protein n=1 Tax=Dermacentor silvarum TaxID=543639 RepID=A0ACB8DH14_DERSI|nr:hypothetical protein HPB49_000162 [Dermacentor silvarum]